MVEGQPSGTQDSGSSTIDVHLDLTPIGDDRTLGADLLKLRIIGDTVFPELVDQLSHAVREMATTAGRIDSAIATAGDWPALLDLASYNTQLHEHMMMTARAMAGTGNALIEIADNLLATDDRVRQEFEAARARLGHYFPRRSDTSALPRPGETTPPSINDDRN